MRARVPLKFGHGLTTSPEPSRIQAYFALVVARNHSHGIVIKARNTARVSMPPYQHQEYPKWVIGRVVKDAAEEAAVRALHRHGPSTSVPAADGISPSPAMQQPSGRDEAERPPTTADLQQMLDQFMAAQARLAAKLAPSDEPSSAALRMQRSRARRKQGLRSVRLDLSDTQIDALVQRGLVNRRRRDDVEEIGRGLALLIMQTLSPA